MDKSQQVAAQAIAQVLEGRNLTQALEQLWRQHPQLTPQQRAMAQDFSYGVLRHYGRLNAILNRLIATNAISVRLRKRNGAMRFMPPP